MCLRWLIPALTGGPVSFSVLPAAIYIHLMPLDKATDQEAKWNISHPNILAGDWCCRERWERRRRWFVEGRHWNIHQYLWAGCSCGIPAASPAVGEWKAWSLVTGWRNSDMRWGRSAASPCSGALRWRGNFKLIMGVKAPWHFQQVVNELRRTSHCCTLEDQCEKIRSPAENVRVMINSIWTRVWLLVLLIGNHSWKRRPLLLLLFLCSSHRNNTLTTEPLGVWIRNSALSVFLLCICQLLHTARLPMLKCWRGCSVTQAFCCDAEPPDWFMSHQ